MPGMIDIHCHILPGIDDGPPDMEASLEMARAAAASGISTVVATPHLRSDFPNVHVDEINARVRELQAVIRAEGIDLQVVPGAEVSVTWALGASDTDLRLATYSQRGSDLLIETPAHSLVGVPEVVHEIRRRGFDVVLAHPERVARSSRDEEMLQQLVNQGVRLQVNASALLPPGSSPSSRAARSMRRNGLVAAIASDAHSALDRRPVTDLATADEHLVRDSGVEIAAWLTRELPSAILEGREAGLPPAPVRRRSRISWRRS